MNCRDMTFRRPTAVLPSHTFLDPRNLCRKLRTNPRNCPRTGFRANVNQFAA